MPWHRLTEKIEYLINGEKTVQICAVSRPGTEDFAVLDMEVAVSLRMQFGGMWTRDSPWTRSTTHFMKFSFWKSEEWRGY